MSIGYTFQLQVRNYPFSPSDSFLEIQIILSFHFSALFCHLFNQLSIEKWGNHISPDTSCSSYNKENVNWWGHSRV